MLLRPGLRLFATGVLVSTWMVLLFSGVVLGGAAHLLLVAALLAFPWRTAEPSEEDRP